MSVEVNFDGLVGPTHNYAGLSLGNLASLGSAGRVSSPKAAALQGIAKMRILHSLDIPQGVFAPHLRPDPEVLSRLGFAASVTPAEIAQVSPAMLAMVMSASPMWTANAATVSPSADTSDHRVHITPANLSALAHRCFEPTQTHTMLAEIFSDTAKFCVHQPLPTAAAFADEGAANHGRLTKNHGQTGTHVFVFNRGPDDRLLTSEGSPQRQSRLASELISRSHLHDPSRVVFVRQAPAAVDAGAFHNDVVSVINENVVFAHELAFEDPEAFFARIPEAEIVQVADKDVPIADAITSYLFNSQLVTLPDTTMTLIAPADVRDTPSTAAFMESAVADASNPIGSVHYLDLHESMSNGGGPACLRLRVALTEEELDALDGRVIADDQLLSDLEHWVGTNYRDELAPADLADPDLWIEAANAQNELAQILELECLEGPGPR